MKVTRAHESERLRRELAAAAPSLTLVIGGDGSGKTSVVREAVRGTDAVRYWAAPLADADLRALLVERLGRWRDAADPHVERPGLKDVVVGEPLPLDAGWPRIFDHLLARAAERTSPLRLILEEFQNLATARPKLLGELHRFWAAVRARGYPVHLVLVGSSYGAFERILDEDGGWGGWVGTVLAVEPLTYREVGALFPAYTPRLRLTTWAVFGGHARHLRPCDPDVTLATNVRQNVLSPDGPLLREGFEQLQRSFQTVGRYASLLKSMAGGRREWRAILAGAPEFVTGGQMAPYLARLQEVGLVRGEASLDARPESRSRRYRITDPFLTFWHRFVLPNLTEILDGRGADVWRYRVRPHLDEHASTLFPIVCREYVIRYARGRLRATARELGGLWGPGYDIEPAGTLRTGWAVYGKVLWGMGRTPERADEALEEEMRRTRYGFGKEVRLRVLFSTDGFSSGLVRRVARSDSIHLIGMDELFAD